MPPQQPNQQQPGVPPQQQPGVPPQQQPNHPAPSGGGKPLLFGGIGVLVGLLVGVLAGSALLGGSGSAGSGADADAQVACSYVEASVGEVNEESMALDQPLIWQLHGAGGLAEAAATGDGSYEAFGEQGRDLFQAASTLDLELAQTTLEAMKQSCADF